MPVRDPAAQRAALARLAELRRELSGRHDRERVVSAMQGTAIDELDGNDFEPGTDCDRITPYEPQGRPSTVVIETLNHELKLEQLRELSTAQLEDARQQLEATVRYERDYGSYVSSYEKQERQLRLVRDVLDERRIPAPEIQLES
jgi:hypothetical protein